LSELAVEIGTLRRLSSQVQDPEIRQHFEFLGLIFEMALLDVSELPHTLEGLPEWKSASSKFTG
jgi:hypothetical protein